MSSQLRISLIIRKLNNRGGAQRQFLSLALELQKLGHALKIYAFSCEREKSFPEFLDQLEIITLPPEKLQKRGGALGFLAEDRMARDLARLIDGDTELLNPHDSPAHHTAYYFKRQVKNVPSVWNVNELPFLRWPPEWELDIDPAIHHTIPRWRLEFSRFSYVLKRAYDRRFVRAQDAIVAIDSAHGRAIRNNLGRESFIAHSGVDVDRFQFVERQPPGKNFKILSSGIFLPYRRFEDVIQAMDLLGGRSRRPALTIAGEYGTDMKYYQALQELARALGLKERITFTGRVSDEELDRLLASHDLFMFPHLQSQALSVYEAMATGLPSILVQLPGSYETLTDGVHAILVPPKDPAALSRAVLSLLKDAEFYRRLSRQGARLVRSRFTWNNYAREMLAVFDEILRHRKS